MLGGYMGRLIWVDLSKKTIESQQLDEKLASKFLGGYGIGLKIIYDRQPANIDPFAENSIVGFATGPLTGTDAVIGSRFTVMGKSPLTGTWGDANCGGYFGPALKQAGYDAIFFEGIADSPVYLLVEDGNFFLKDASNLWGKTTYKTEDILKKKHGKNVQVASIGPAGEKESLIACIIHDKGRAAGRFGFGALLGHKKIKAVVVCGDEDVPVSNLEKTKELRRESIRQIRKDKIGASASYLIGTPGYTVTGAYNGDSPVKNWSSNNKSELGSSIEALDYNNLFEYRTKKYGCWKCPIACSGFVKLADEEYSIEEAHQPEYETLAAFGSNCNNSNLESIMKTNDICNKYGIDTITTGSLVAYVIECYEKGLIDKEQVDGMDLGWGKDKAIVELTKKIATVEGVGGILAKGFEGAINFFGEHTEEYAIHIKGEALAMHDPRFEPAMAVIYKMFPGKHIQASQFIKPPGFKGDFPDFGEERNKQRERGEGITQLEYLCNIVNCSGLCVFGYLSTYVDSLSDFLTSVTGINWDMDRLFEIGKRISNMRQAFNIREGVNIVKTQIPARALGRPPLKDGPTANVQVDIEEVLSEYFGAMNWSQDDARPSRETLQQLGLTDIIKDLY